MDKDKAKWAVFTLESIGFIALVIIDWRICLAVYALQWANNIGHKFL